MIAISENHNYSSEEIYKRTVKFFDEMKKKYNVTSTLLPDKKCGSFEGTYTIFLVSIKIWGEIGWNDKSISVFANADKFEDKVAERIREEIRNALL